MDFCARHGRKIRWIAALLLILVIIGSCAGIKPYEPRNDREEGPKKGLFTGSEGEWVIVGPKKADSDKEKEEDPDKSTENKQE